MLGSPCHPAQVGGGRSGVPARGPSLRRPRSRRKAEDPRPGRNAARSRRGREFFIVPHNGLCHKEVRVGRAVTNTRATIRSFAARIPATHCEIGFPAVPHHPVAPPPVRVPRSFDVLPTNCRRGFHSQRRPEKCARTLLIQSSTNPCGPGGLHCLEAVVAAVHSRVAAHPGGLVTTPAQR